MRAWTRLTGPAMEDTWSEKGPTLLLAMMCGSLGVDGSLSGVSGHVLVLDISLSSEFDSTFSLPIVLHNTW